MRRLALVLGLVGLLALPAGAGAHPLGNFSINHVVRVRVDAGALRLHYILDQAEIPTFQERALAHSVVLARKLREVRRGLVATAGGRSVALRMAPGPRLTHPPGQGGLRLTRLEVDLVGRIPARGAIRVRDGTFGGRVGWRALVAVAGTGTAVRASAPRDDPTRGLRSYPRSALQSPLDERSASFAVAPGSGTLEAPRSPFAGSATTANRAGDGLAGVFSRAAGGQGVLLFLLLAAFGWGALHALSPGHGKTMVAAYLVGARGTARHALALGATVTISHTIGVFALGLVTLALSAYVLPEDLFPWLNLASGLLVVGIGGGVLRGRLRHWRHGHADADHRHHDHGHGHDHHGHGHGHDHGHPHDDHGHGHGHHHHDAITWKGLLGMGASAGMIPCPSALVVLLAGIAAHQVALGLVLIAAFSLGLATTISLIGVAVVSTRGLAVRFAPSGAVVAALPAASALVIVAAGLVLTVRALAQIG